MLNLILKETNGYNHCDGVAKHPKKATVFSQLISDEDRDNNWHLYDEEADVLYSLIRREISEIKEENLEDIILIPLRKNDFSDEEMGCRTRLPGVPANIYKIEETNDGYKITPENGFCCGFNSLEELTTPIAKNVLENTFVFYEKFIRTDREDEIEEEYYMVEADLDSAVELLIYDIDFEFKGTREEIEKMLQNNHVNDFPVGADINLFNNLHLLTNADRTAFWKIKKDLSYESLVKAISDQKLIVMLPKLDFAPVNISTVSEENGYILVIDNVTKTTVKMRKENWLSNVDQLMCLENNMSFEFFLVERFDPFKEMNTEEEYSIGDILETEEGIKYTVLEKDSSFIRLFSENNCLETYCLDELTTFKRVGHTDLVNQLTNLLQSGE